MEREFDVVVVGAGPAGEVAAGRLVDRGQKSVALVERHLIGGECSFYACMPSKALLRPPEALREVRRVPGAAEATTGRLDVGAALARRDQVIHNLSDAGQLPWIEDRGIELFRGEARLDGERRVLVDEHLLLARDAVVLAVGTGAMFPPIPGLAEVHAWSNREITTARSVPPRLIVLGGGFVGVEMAQAWNSLGAQVTLIEALERLIAREEEIASEEVRGALEREGVDVRTAVRAEEVARDDEEVVVRLSDGEEVPGERLLVAIGRKPLTEELGIDPSHLNDRGYVEVNPDMRVPGAPWLYAVGDVNGRSLLTHAGKYQARIAADHILGEDVHAVSDAPGSPRVVFTDPQVAAVGLTLTEARERGIPTSLIDVPTDGNAGTSFYGRGSGGTSRFIVDRERQVLVGATFIGADVNDFLHAATIAVVGGVPLRTLAHAIPAFPTRSEIWLELIESYEREHRLTLHA